MPQLDKHAGKPQCSRACSHHALERAVALIAVCCVILLAAIELRQQGRKSELLREQCQPPITNVDVAPRNELLLDSLTRDADAHRVVAEYLPPRHSTKTPNPEMHVVMLGDSVMRYQYLDLIYRLHTCAYNSNETNTSKRPGNQSPHECPQPPHKLLFNNRTQIKQQGRKQLSSKPIWIRDYMTFFRYGVSLFNGSMSCDCSRLGLDNSIETRSYRHPTRMLRVSFIQVFGERNLLTRARLRTYRC